MSDLRRKRKAAELTLEQLARLSGVNRMTLCYAETRNLLLRPHEQKAIDKVLARHTRRRLKSLQEMVGAEMATE